MELINYFQPSSIFEAKSLLSMYPNSKLLAGGTDLLLDIKRNKERPPYLVDLNRIMELKEINETYDEVTIGSMVTFTQLKENSLIQKYFISLIESAKSMGSPQIRNMATIGGNIINGGASADSTPCIISLDGILVFESIDGERKISCEAYFKDNLIEKIKDNEILTKIILPKKGALTAFYKLGKRNSLAIARMNTAISLELKDDSIKNLSICLGAVGRYPFRVKELELKAIDKKIDWLYSDEVLEILENAVAISIKGRKTMPFKKEGIKGVYKEALRITLDQRGDS